MRKLSYFGKQLLSYSLLMMAAVLILIFWAHSYVIDISEEKAKIHQEQLTNSTLNQVDSYLDQIMLITTQVAHDTEIVTFMEQLQSDFSRPGINYFAENPQAGAKVAQILTRHNNIQNPVVRIGVFSANGDYICNDPSEDVMAAHVELIREDWFQRFLPRVFIEEDRDFIMMGPLRFQFPKDLPYPNCIYMLMPIQNHEKTQTYGYVQVIQSLDPLFAQLDLDHETDTDIYLFYEENKRDRAGQFYPLDKEFPDTSTGTYYETSLLSHYRWFVVLLQDRDAFLASYQNMILYLLLGGLALFALLFSCVFLLLRRTCRPILELSSRVKDATLTNLPNLPVSADALDEVKELEQSVDHMIQRLKTSVELEQQAYLKALQAQMKPHFLYNCLSTISSLGTESGSLEIPRFCSHLASILRYDTTYKNENVTLADELSNVRDYLALMQIRYEDDLVFRIDVDQAILSIPLPRLTLQPLVENCFSHGFKTVEPPWCLSIQGFLDGDCWVIQICDNGIGIEHATQAQLYRQIDSLMQDLRNGEKELGIGGLGLANTVARLRLMSTEEIGFSISPNETGGTILTLRGKFHV